MMPTKGCRGADPCQSNGDAAGPNAFVRLVRIIDENERLLRELDSINAKLEVARAYLVSPDCHLPLALGNLAHLKTKRSGLLTLLRASRIAAEEVVGPLEPA